MRVAILQSNYIPWKGYFDIIGMVDLFIFHDDLQYTKGDWRNRNQIKSPQGLSWLTIPVGTNEKRLICDVEIKDKSWQEKHWRLIEASYKKAPFFNFYESFLKQIYLQTHWSNLSDMNQVIIKRICREHLGIMTNFDDSRKFDLKAAKGARVIELLKKAGAGSYLSGPAAKAYLEPELFESEGINLEWMNYNGYPEYPQLYPPFQGSVSIIDMLLNLGPTTRDHMHIGNKATTC